MFKGHCFPKEVILHAVNCKLRFSLSYRDLEEFLSTRGVTVDHATIQRWVYKFTPLVWKFRFLRSPDFATHWSGKDLTINRFTGQLQTEFSGQAERNLYTSFNLALKSWLYKCSISNRVITEVFERYYCSTILMTCNCCNIP